MARIGLIDHSGDLHAIAVRLDQEGHAVRYWIKRDPRAPEKDNIGRGIVPRVDGADFAAQGADLVIAYALPKEADAFRATGIPVIGSSQFATDLETNRQEAAALAKKAGMTVPFSAEFSDAKNAWAFVDKQDVEEWAFKAEGNEAGVGSSHVCQSKAHLQAVLQYEAENPKIKKFILQHVVHGVEISTEGWFNKGWVLPFNSTLERKRFGAGDVGDNVGCMGSIVWPWAGDHPKLVRETLEGWESVLEDGKHVGPFDINAILGVCPMCGEGHEKNSPHFIEPTPRLGWNAFHALMAGIPDGDLGDFLVEFGQGGADRMPVRPAMLAALRTYVSSDGELPLVAPWETDSRFYLGDVWHDGTRLLSCGVNTTHEYNIAFELANMGRSLEDAIQPIYTEMIPQVVADGLFYRADIGEQAGRDLAQLAGWGYEVPGDWEQPSAPASQRAGTSLTGRRRHAR